MTEPADLPGADFPPLRTLPLWVGLAAVVLWMRWPVAWWLVGSSLAVVTFALTAPGGILKKRLAAALLLLANLAGFTAHLQLAGLDRDWPAFWSRQEQRVERRLADEMDRLSDRGDAAVAEIAAASVAELTPDFLRAVREQRGLDAVAVYDPGGLPIIWDGVHQGEVPEEARFGFRPYAYGETPLYGYLYFTSPMPGGQGVAMGAALMREELPPPLGLARPADFVTRFRDRYGEEVRISRPTRAGEVGVFDYHWQGVNLLSLQVVPPAQADRRDSIIQGWVRVVALFAVMGWLFATLGERHQRRYVPALLTALLMAGSIPWGGILGVPRLFTAGDFLLPGPLEMSVGRLLALALAAAFLSGFVEEPRGRGAVWAGILVALAFPLILLGFGSSAAPNFLGRAESNWLAYQITLALVLSIVALLALRLGSLPGRSRPRPLLLGLAIGAVGVLAAGIAGFLAAGAGAPLWVSALWAAPTVLIATALGSSGTWTGRTARLAAAALIGCSAALAFAWGSRVQAKMELAEVEMADLGVPVDPYLEFLLERFARELAERDDPTLRPIEHLYSAWAGSGLAEEGYPLWLTLWEEQNTQREELPIDVVAPRPSIVDSLIPAARSLPITVQRLDDRDVQYVVTVPLSRGWMGSAAVPPRRELLASTALGPLFAHVERRVASPVTLVPEGIEGVSDSPDVVRWTPTPDGYVGERGVRFPEGWYRARFHLDLPDPLLLVARGTLLLVAGIVLFMGVGLVGTLARGVASRGPGRHFRADRTSFRSRVTVALFGFFLLSTAAIGTVAFRTLAGTTVLTATALGERIADEAGEELAQDAAALPTLAVRVGADLVLYRDGALDRGAVHELVELGLYPGWMPFSVSEEFSDGDAVLASETVQLGTWEHVMVFRRLGSGVAVATPIPVTAGASAVRRREGADLLAFAILGGAALSFALALLVGRALSRPIQTLQIASERVGGGNLAVTLPERGPAEFGAVFHAFNRMVQRLAATREELIRATRRTAAIVEEAATGVIATDTDGNVVLVNPRAETILGRDLALDRPLGGDGPAGALGGWIRRYLSDGIPEGSTEFEFGERRVRVRGRRISRSEPYGGAVFSVEDVTDELRAERVLAWGEMARQVAHEVKNPLTPIKLSVQHIQRAWGDGVQDFDAVLNRNAEAVLREIDRLAEIAGSFSRFAAPQSAAQTPLESVHLPNVVDEVLTLYRGAGDGSRFLARLPESLPPVSARVGELKEVLLNLLENARAALEERGGVEVTAQARKGSVLLTVRDEGSGIPSSLLIHIFEPHFSTRSSGTGLGLAIVKRLVESWGGSVTAESEEGVGTEIHLIIPVWEEPV